MSLRLKNSMISRHMNHAALITSTRRMCVRGSTLPTWRANPAVCVPSHHHGTARGSVRGARWSSTQVNSSSSSPAASSSSSSLFPRASRAGSDDFVDLGLGGTGAGAGVGEQPALGVTREQEVPDGQEYSRLNIPVAKEDGRTVGDLAVTSTEAAAGEEEKEEESKDATPLPYDDELFAEMLLKMEVEGALDETWQDARKAHMEDVVEIVEVLRSLKVRDICAIDVSAKTSNFDYMIFGSCEGPRHIHLAAWAVQEADFLKRVSKIKRKQTDHTWETVPVGRIVVNLMQESFREEMTLERKWAVTKSMDPLTMANAPVSEGRQVRAHGLWTLTLNLQDLEDFEMDYCKDVLMRQL